MIFGPYTKPRGSPNSKYSPPPLTAQFVENWRYDQWENMDNGSIWFQYNAYCWNNLPEGAD